MTVKLYRSNSDPSKIVRAVQVTEITQDMVNKLKEFLGTRLELKSKSSCIVQIESVTDWYKVFVKGDFVYRSNNNNEVYNLSGSIFNKMFTELPNSENYDENYVENIFILKSWETYVNNLDTQLASLENIMGDISESPLYQAICDMSQEYTKTVSKIVGDKAAWLYWYYVDNNMGKKALRVTIKEEEFEVSSVEDLYKCIKGVL